MSTSASMPSSGTLRRSPYQGLIPYGEDDAPYFFGREKEARLIAANLFASPLTLLYGASGVGKSSVLRAGVAHQLRQRDDLLVVVFNAWQRNPVGDLKQAVATAAALADHNGVGNAMRLLTQDQGTSLVEFLAICAEKLDRRLMIILDQFEEYFLYHAQNEEFATEFPKAVRQSDAPVSFLISIREDFYAKLDRFEGTVPALYDNYLRLEHLDRKAAQVAIEKPIEQYNRRYAKAARPFSIEPELVEAVLRQVETGQVILGEAGRGVVEATKANEDAEARIETPYLQLVMTRLWDEEVGERSHNLRLQTLSELGGAENIVRKHLDAVMSALLPREQEIAACIFHYLVTPSGTKIAYSASDLAGSAELDEPEVVGVLERLSEGDIRILRPVDPPIDRPTALRYEIFHDVLAPAILTWRTGYVQAQERAEAQHRAEEQQREAEEQARAGEQARVAGRLRRLSVALAVVTLLVLGFAAYAMTLRAQALASAERANTAAVEAGSEKAIAQEQRLLAVDESNRADAQKVIAEGKATEAENARAEADAQRGIAIAEGARANNEAALATYRELAAAAAGNLNSDPELSVLLGLEALSKLSGHAVTEADEKEARTVLHEALQTSRVRLTLPLFDRPKDAPVFGATDLNFSLDGKRVVIVGRNGIATVWDAATGKKLLVLSAALERVERSALSADGCWFAAAGPAPADSAAAPTTGSPARSKVVLWNTATGISVNVPCENRLGNLWSLFFINAGKTLVLGGYISHRAERTGSITLQMWDVEARQPGEFLDLSNGLATLSPSYVAISSDAKRILTYGKNGEATLWEAPSLRVLQTIRTSSVPALSLDGKHVAAFLNGESPQLNVLDGSGKPVRTLCSPEAGGCPEGFEKLAFSPDGKNLAGLVVETGAVRVWEVASGQMLITTSGYSRNEAALGRLFDPSNKQRAIQTPAFGFSGDGRLFAAYNGVGTVKVWSASSGNEFFTLAGHKGLVTSMALSRTGQHLITGSDDGTARIWDTTRSHEIITISRLGESRLIEVDNVTFSPDGTHLAGSLKEGGVGVWNATTWKDAYPAPLRTWGRCVAYSPDGKQLAVGDERGSVTMVVADSGKLIDSPFKLANGTIHEVAFSPDGKRLAAAAGDNGAYILDTSDHPGTKPTGIGGRAISVAFSPDGRYLATGSADGTATLWDARTHAQLHVLRGHDDAVWRVAFSPDSKRIATASHDRFVRIWDVASGARSIELSGHRDKVWGVAFSPRGKYIATASSDLTTKVWDARTGEELLTLSGHTQTVNQAAFSPDELRLATCSDDGTIRVYTLDKEKLIALARARISPGRTLTPDERKRYLHEVIK